MMGPRQQRESKLFYTDFHLDERIPKDHFLRRLDAILDLDFVRPAVSDFYGSKGNKSIDPIILIKLMLLLFLESSRSERQLVKDLAFRLDWLWFCELDLDDDIPNHSVLSKARALWGVELFESLFSCVLGQCISAGLVDGKAIHVDSSCIDGNVDSQKLQPVLRVACQQLAGQLDDQEIPGASAELVHPSGRLTASSDQEAGVTRNKGRTLCGYKDHRAVDDAHGIITATVTTDAATNEGNVLEDVIDAHEVNTGETTALVAADKQYGTGENYRHLRQRKITPCIPHKKALAPKGKFSHDQFIYDSQTDSFTCPGGQRLSAYENDYSRGRIRYRPTKGVCLQCPKRQQCTDNKLGRTVGRQMDQEHIDWADKCLSQGRRRHWMKRRKSVVEGSFADGANNHGFKRARWRGLAKMTMQNLLIAVCQNLRKLLKSKPGSGHSAITTAATTLFGGLMSCFVASWADIAYSSCEKQ